VGINRKTPLLKCEIIHSIKGRIRIGIRALQYLEDYSEDLAKNLNNITAIREAHVNSLTKNILIFYDSQVATPEDLLEIVEAVFSSYSLVAHKRERDEKNQLTVTERRIQEESISTMVKRLVITGATIGYSAIANNKTTVGGSFLSRFTTIPAIGSIALSTSIFKSGIKSLVKTHRPNADTLTMASIVTSLITGRDVSALTTILLSDIAELLTAYTMNRTRNAIKDMLHVGEEFVWLQRTDGSLKKVSIKEVQKDDLVVVHTGEKISVDGIVQSGEGVIDQASITGEFMPILKEKGENVFAGTVVKSGNITIKAQKIGDQTAVSKIVHLVEEASHQKAQMQVYADKFSAQAIPLNFALAGLVYAFTKSVTRALNMMIIDYSCGVRLSTATALSAAIHTAAKNGVLVKGGNYIESLAESDTLILDKTGTMTEGKPKIISIVPAHEDMTPRRVVEIASAAEEVSTHPMAVAVMNKINRSGWNIPAHGETKVHVGRGVETDVDGKIVLVGNKKFMKENHIEINSLKKEINQLSSRGENVIYVGYDGKFIGIFGIQDTLRENMKKSINRLRQLGIDDAILLTGDIEHQAEIIASRMAMDRFESELLPEDKAKSVLQLQSKGSKVIMVGDGINDAPALAYADVGVALGGGTTDIAVEAADITITRDEPLLIPSIVNLSKVTMKIVKQNFATTIGINSLGLILGSIGVLPVFWGSVLHNFSTIAVVLNSTRLLYHDFERRT
jgi:cation-transporting P-type ATPase C